MHIRGPCELNLQFVLHTVLGLLRDQRHELQQLCQSSESQDP